MVCTVLHSEQRKGAEMMDNYDLWEQHDAEQEEWLRSKPKCCRCGEHIQQEEAVEYDGEYWCEECEEFLWKKIRREYLEEI